MDRDKDIPPESNLKMDEQLVLECKKGQSDSFNTLIYRYQQAVFGYVNKRVRDHSAAEDVVQETFITAFRSIQKIEKPASFKSWLLGIAHNCCMRWFEKSSRTTQLDDYIQPVSDESPEKAFREQEVQEIIQNVINSLSGEVKEIFQMRYQKQFSWEEIAKKLKKPVGTVASLLSRAYQKLRNDLSFYFEEMK